MKNKRGSSPGRGKLLSNVLDELASELSAGMEPGVAIIDDNCCW